MKKQLNNLKRLIFVAAVALVLVAIPIYRQLSPQIQHNYLRSKVGKNVVMITESSGQSGGTGSYVKAPSGQVFILTNAHICKMPSPIFVGEVQVMPIEISDTADLCLVTIPKGKDVRGLGLDINDGALALGQLINAVGHPMLYPLTLTQGEYQGEVTISVAIAAAGRPDQCPYGTQPYDAFFYYVCLKTYKAAATTVSILPGNSGSPVVDDDGELVGVMFASDQSGRGHAVRLIDVQEFMKGR